MARLSILLAGTGYVGSALGRLLRADGHEVWALCRDPSRVQGDFRPIQADLTDAQCLRALPADLRHVVFSASADESSDAAYERIYVKGLGNLLSVLEARAVAPRVFFTSSTAVYAQQDGSWVDEDSVTEPSHFSGQRTLQAERRLTQSPLETTTLRCSGIYGPGRQRLIDGLREGRLTLPPVDRYTNRIHRDDVAGLIHHLITHDIARDRVLVSDDEPALYSTVLSTLAEQLGVPRPGLGPDAPPLRFGGHKRCNNRRLHELGYHLRYPTFREGYAEMLQS